MRGAALALMLAWAGHAALAGNGSGPASAGGASFPGFRGGAGPVCGSRDLVGEPIPGIEGPGGCGVRRPVRLRSVAGVALAPPPTITCGAALALEQWVTRGLKPAAARARARVVELGVLDHYACRNRNRARTGKLSTHARGEAIDIARFRFADGAVATVLEDWTGSRWSDLIRRAHAAGCGPFSTALGPGADRFHADHLHFDVERRRGAYCR